MTFQLDAERELDELTSATLVNDERNMTTYYAVVCVGSAEHGPGDHHGGVIASDAATALKAAQDANDVPRRSQGCQYIPVALALDVLTAVHLLQSELQVPPDEQVPPAEA